MYPLMCLSNFIFIIVNWCIKYVSLQSKYFFYRKNEPKTEPTQSNAQQAESAKKPTESAKKPTESAKKATESVKKPTDSAKEPTESTKEPTESAKKPTEPAKQPTQVDYMKAKSVHEFTVKDIHGNEVKLDRYKGQVLLIVNVASQCGYTDGHYKQLNELYEKYSNKGLRILAFPCNQFGYQEPGTPQEILQFTKAKQVKFDLFEKVAVNGADAHPLWNFLKRMQGGTLGDFVKWNFSKFIVDKNGVPVERFGPNTDPLELVPYLEKLFDQ